METSFSSRLLVFELKWNQESNVPTFACLLGAATLDTARESAEVTT
jgi:hypothetical protein